MKTYVDKEITYVAGCYHCDWHFISNDTKLIETERQQHESIDH